MLTASLSSHFKLPGHPCPSSGPALPGPGRIGLLVSFWNWRGPKCWRQEGDSMVLSCGLEVWPPGFRHFTTSHLGFSACAERRVGAAAGAGTGPTVGALLTSEPCGCGARERVPGSPVHRALGVVAAEPPHPTRSPSLAGLSGPSSCPGTGRKRDLSVSRWGPLFVRKDLSIRGLITVPEGPGWLRADSGPCRPRPRPRGLWVPGVSGAA